MNMVIHCFATWGLIYTSSWMKYKVKQNMNVINLYPVSIGANNCTRNKITVKLIHWTSGFVLLIFTGSELQTLSKQCLCFVRPCFWPGPLQRTWEGEGSSLQGRVKIIHGTVPNRKPMELLWTNSYTAEALFSWSGDIYFELLFLVFHHLSTKIHLDWNLALKDMV